MFGIVWFHSGVGVCRVVAHGGLMFFIIISVYFAVTSRRRHSLAERAGRLLVPCLAWSVFYGLIFYVRRGHVFPENYTLPSMVLATPSIHLWFLPFIFLVLVGIDRLRNIFEKPAVPALAGAAAIVSLLSAPLWQDMHLADPFTQYLYSVPAVFIGIFFGCYGRGDPLAGRLISATIVLSLLVLICRFHSEVGTLYMVGIVPCIFLFYSNVILAGNKTLFLLSSSVFGIYLLHPFWQMFFRFIGVTSCFLPIATFVLSMASVLLVKELFPGGIAAVWRPVRNRWHLPLVRPASAQRP